MMILDSILLTWSLSTFLLQIGSTPIWVPLTIILIIILLFWWGLTRNRIQDESDAHEGIYGDADVARSQVVTVDSKEDVIEEIEESEEPTTVIEPVGPIEPDDLKLIEGIGPKISSVLADAGIVTFSQLADSDLETLDKIVREDAGIKLANPSTWPEQAKLAANGNWDELEQLQEDLHAGQRK